MDYGIPDYQYHSTALWEVKKCFGNEEYGTGDEALFLSWMYRKLFDTEIGRAHV